MKQYFITYDQTDFSRFEFYGETQVQKKFILLGSKNEEDAEIEAIVKWKKIWKTARGKWDKMAIDGIKTKLSFHDWQPKNPSLVMKKILTVC